MPSNRQTPRELALEDVARHRETAARWEAEKAAAEQELESLQQRAGEEVLADESAAKRLPVVMQQLRDRIDIADRALAAVRPLLVDSGRRAVLAEAGEWDGEAEKRQKAFDAHVARIGTLLEELREHDGVAYGVLPRQRGSRRHQLELEVERARFTAHVLRELAEGRDPRAELQARASVDDGTVYGLEVQEYYTPSVWGPDAVLPAPAYVATLPADG